MSSLRWLLLVIAVSGSCAGGVDGARPAEPAPAAEPALLAQWRRAVANAPLVVAHRGASEDFPENTIAALRAAAAAGADAVEFDVWQSKDGRWVLMHDATLDRTTDAEQRLGASKLAVDQVLFADLRTLDAGSWKHVRFAGERVPTLAEAIAAVAPAIPVVERKGGDAGALATALRELVPDDRVLVIAFDWQWLRAFHAAAPNVMLGALGNDPLSPAQLDAAAATGARVVDWDHRKLDIDAARRVRSAGHLLCSYTVDHDVALLGAAAIGSDLITTNRPARLLELRQQGLLQRVDAAR